MPADIPSRDLVPHPCADIAACIGKPVEIDSSALDVGVYAKIVDAPPLASSGTECFCLLLGARMAQRCFAFL